MRAFNAGSEYAEPWQDAHTYAAGLRVPRAVGDFLMLRALRESGGGAIAVTDEAMAVAVRQLGSLTGVFGAPEGGAAVAAVPLMCDRGVVRAEDEVVIFNTGRGLKYVAP